MSSVSLIEEDSLYVVRILFEAELHNETVNYNRLKQKLSTYKVVSGKRFIKILKHLESLGLITSEYKEKGKLKYRIIKLTETGKIIGWSTFLNNFMQAYLSLLEFLSTTGYFEIKMPKEMKKDKVISELIVNLLWTVTADLTINGFKTMVLKGSPNHAILRLLFENAFANMSNIFDYAIKNVDREVLLSILDEAYKQAQREFLKYLIERIDLRDIYAALLKLKEQAPQRYLKQVETLMNFIIHLMKTAASKGIKIEN